MTIIYAFLIVVIILGVGGIYYAIYFNRLQDDKVRIDEAESILDDALRNKYDVIVKIKGLIENKVKDNKINLKEVDKLKDVNISNFDLDRRLKEIYSLIEKIRDDYKELDDVKEFRSLTNEIKRADEKITAAKQYYNKYTSSLNALIAKFPSNIIAKLHGIEARTYFDGKDMNDEIVDDFKL